MCEDREPLMRWQLAGTSGVLSLCDLAQGLSASRTLLSPATALMPRGRGGCRVDHRETYRSAAVVLPALLTARSFDSRPNSSDQRERANSHRAVAGNWLATLPPCEERAPSLSTSH